MRLLARPCAHCACATWVIALQIVAGMPQAGISSVWMPSLPRTPLPMMIAFAGGDARVHVRHMANAPVHASCVHSRSNRPPRFARSSCGGCAVEGASHHVHVSRRHVRARSCMFASKSNKRHCDFYVPCVRHYSCRWTPFGEFNIPGISCCPERWIENANAKLVRKATRNLTMHAPVLENTAACKTCLRSGQCV